MLRIPNFPFRFDPTNRNVQNVQRYSGLACQTRIMLKDLKINIRLIFNVSILWHDARRIFNYKRNFYFTRSLKISNTFLKINVMFRFIVYNIKN